MNQNALTHDTRTEPIDALDRLLGDYFQAQLPRPWPAAPAGTVLAEPTALVAASDAVRREPATRDSNRRARFTLAASVALLLGTCFYFSNGFQPGARTNDTATPGGLLQGAEASKPAPALELRQDRAIKGKGGMSRPIIKLP